MSESARGRIPAFRPLCASRCGCEAVVEDGRLLAIEPDPSHPTGKALCAKGRASPALVEASDRLLYPVRRTRPKGDPLDLTLASSFNALGRRYWRVQIQSEDWAWHCQSCQALFRAFAPISAWSDTRARCRTERGLLT
jgi:predicted molibdopterin-dependent oxidoreductase YjgC